MSTQNLLTTESVTVDMLTRMAIVEAFEGDGVVITMELGKIVLEGEANTAVTFSLNGSEEIPEGDEYFLAIVDHFTNKLAPVTLTQGVSRISVEGIIVRSASKDYLIEESMFIMRNVMIVKDGNPLAVPPIDVPLMAQKWGLNGEDHHTIPLCMYEAINSKDEPALCRVRKKLRRYPSLIGKENFKPKRYALIVSPQSPEEYGIRWRI